MIINITIEKSEENYVNLPIMSDTERFGLQSGLTRTLLSLVKHNIKQSCALDISDADAMDFMELSLNKGQVDDESFRRVMDIWLAKLIRKYKGNGYE